MPSTKISDLTAMTTAAAGDLLVAVDIADTTMAPTGTDKRITAGELLTSGLPAEFSTIDGNGGTVTASDPVLDISQTWNNAAVAFQGARIKITNNASLPSPYGYTQGSMPFVVTDGSDNVMSGFGRDGGLWFGGAGYSQSRLYKTSPAGATVLDCSPFGGGNGGFEVYGGTDHQVGALINPLATYPTVGFSFGLSNRLGNAANAAKQFWYNDGTIHQRNGSVAQTYYVYGTYTDASNFVRASLGATSTAVNLAANTAGTGADEVSINLTPAGAYAARLVLQGSATSNPGWSIGETAGSPYIIGSSGGNNSISFKAYSFAWEQVNVGTAMVIESGTGCVGIGTTSPTAYLDLPASTTSAASLRIRTGTAPTSPNSGDVWHDSTQKTVSYRAADVNQTVNGVLFTQTNTVTVADTVTETALTGTGVGTLTLPANFFVAGKTIKIRALGFHSSTASPDITLRFKLGSTTVLTTGAISSGNGTDESWICDACLTCRTTGATGTVIGQGYYDELHGNGSTGGMVNTAATTIDTTASQAISLTVEWGTANAGNTISCTNLLIEILN